MEPTAGADPEGRLASIAESLDNKLLGTFRIERCCSTGPIPIGLFGKAYSGPVITHPEAGGCDCCWGCFSHAVL